MPNHQATSRKQWVIQLIQGIKQDLVDYQALYQLMQHQQQCYIQFDGTALSQNLAQQQPLISRLQLSTQQRSQLLQQLGLAHSQQGLQQIFKLLPAAMAQQVSQAWLQLENLSKSCHKLNQKNGRLSANCYETLQQQFGLQLSGQQTYTEASLGHHY